MEGKCKDVSVTIKPAKNGHGCKGSALVRQFFELMGLNDYDIAGPDISLSCIRAGVKALCKIK